MYHSIMQYKYIQYIQYVVSCFLTILYCHLVIGMNNYSNTIDVVKYT